MSDDTNIPSGPPDPEVFSSLSEDILRKARQLGASDADLGVVVALSLEVGVRAGTLETVERSEARDLGLRLFFGQRQACASTSDMTPSGLHALVERVAAMARKAPEDPFCGLAPVQEQKKDKGEDLQLYNPDIPSVEALEARAHRLEQAALECNHIVQTEGAGASWGGASFWLANSHGFQGGWRSSSQSLGVSALAEKNGAKERDYDSWTARFEDDLKTPEELGRKAGMRAAARLGARQGSGMRAPVLFENRVASSLVSAFAGLASGPSVARGASFLKDQLGEAVFSPHITLIDDPKRLKGLASRPFDGEGVETQKQAFVDKGVLKAWFLNAASARHLKMDVNGCARHAPGSPPGAGPSNLTLLPGTHSVADLLGGIKKGLHVTEAFGPSLNPHTGDYSVGVSGFWIEDGLPSYPVHEMTVAGNLAEMFRQMIPGDDPDGRGGIDAPSLLIEDLAIAGQ